MERITVQTSIKSDIDKVWQYWTKPEHITNWNFATDEWCCPNAENDKTERKFLLANGSERWKYGI